MRIKYKMTTKQIFIPKSAFSSLITHKLELYSELSKITYTYVLTDRDNLPDFYVFDVDFSDLPDGEYIYQVDTEDAKGLILIGNTESFLTQLNNNEDEKIISYTK